MDLLPGEILLPGGGVSNLTSLDSNLWKQWNMASNYTLFWWHPIRGVRHETWDNTMQLTTHVESLERFERQWMDTLTYYAFDREGDTWWYYCKPPVFDTERVTATQIRLQHQDPWQRRDVSGIPKEIRAYKLLLG